MALHYRTDLSDAHQFATRGTFELPLPNDLSRNANGYGVGEVAKPKVGTVHQAANPVNGSKFAFTKF